MMILNRWGFSVRVETFDYEEQTEQLKPKIKRETSVLFGAIEEVWDHEVKKTGARFPNIMIAVSFRKVSGIPFKVPMQGKYVDDITSDSIRKNYS